MANSKDESTESEFPGYPHYPAKEDIMNSKDNERVDLDVENLSRSKPALSGAADKSVRPRKADDDTPLLADVDDDAEDTKEISETDITPEDLIALGEAESGFGTVDKLAGEDLDIPGAEEDDANEDIGEEDEENNYYSLGGDGHDNLEEDRGG